MTISNTGNSTDLASIRSTAASTTREQSSAQTSGTAAPSNAPGSSTTPPPVAPNATVSDVNISAAGQELSRAPSGDPQANFDSARVSQIRAAIEAGDYPIDSEKLADSILRLERELGFD